MNAIGIDFGTSFSRLAFLHPDGMPEIFPHSHAQDGAGAVPSLVFMAEDGSMRAGHQARQSPRHQTHLYLSALKRLMAFPEMPVWANRTRLGAAKLNAQGALAWRGRLWSMQGIVEFFLKNLKSGLSGLSGPAKIEAVISLPRAFGAAARDQLKKSVMAAAFDPLAFLPETSAAALAYSRLKHKRGKAAVVSWGGGFLEASILDFREGEVVVLASEGDASIGGMDLDARMAEKLVQEISESAGRPLELDGPLVELLLEESERAKCSLSHRGSVDLKIQDAARGIRFVRALSCFELSNWVRDFTDRAGALCARVLAGSGTSPDSLDDILLSGSSTRIPVFLEQMEKVFGRKPAAALNPELAVAFGTAIYAGMLSGTISDLELKDESGK